MSESDLKHTLVTSEKLPSPLGPYSAGVTLGDLIFEWFLLNKRTEWSEYQRQVTPFELETYLPNW